MHEPTLTYFRQSLDVALGSVAVSTPLWLNGVEDGLKLFMLVGGSVLLVVRIALALRDWKRGKKEDN